MKPKLILNKNEKSFAIILQKLEERFRNEAAQSNNVEELREQCRVLQQNNLELDAKNGDILMAAQQLRVFDA